MSRVNCNYRPENGRFLLECDFSKQYHHYYRKRLEKTRPFLEYNCRQRWGSNLTICSLAEMNRYLECIVIGTIFKRMKLQPDVVSELSKGDFHVKCERYLGHYTSQDDTLVLEDNEESVQLVGNIKPDLFVTGIVVALSGASIDDGSKFLVYDVCYAEPNPCLLYDEAPDSLLDVPNTDSDPVFLLVVSGLGFHPNMDKKSKVTKALQDLIDFVWGGEKFADDERSSRVGRVIVVGNCLHADRSSSLDDKYNTELDKETIVSRMKKSRQVKPYVDSIQATKYMDDFFAQLARTINVEVMPGPSDPSSHLMPQQPFHPCMFPKSCMFHTFNCTTNPNHAIYYDNIEVLATSGQNVDIISKFSGLVDPIEIMKCQLRWGNSAPSAPDNLYSLPYEDEDPYVIDFIPDIYIVGCQKSFQTDYHYYTNVETIPSQQQLYESFEGLPEKSDISEREHELRKRESSILTEKTIEASRNANVERIDSRESSNEINSSPKRYRKNRTLLVTVPEFHETQSCVLIDLRSLSTQLITFN